jgi:hypothetical protein
MLSLVCCSNTYTIILKITKFKQLASKLYDNIMPIGDWCAGKTKLTDDKVTRMAQNVSKALREPALRKRLTEQKRLSKEEILHKIAVSKTSWELLSDLSCYTRQSDKNILCACAAGHQSMISVVDIINDVNCKVCHPIRNAGNLNPAYKSIDTFIERLIPKFGHDMFEFDPDEFDGMYGSMEFRCTTCLTMFTKAPRALLNERHGCPCCARKAKGDKQRRSRIQFLNKAKLIHGDKFTFAPELDQKYGNANTITRTCGACQTTEQQSIGSFLSGNGCSTCSKKKKHTTESFIALSKRIWGGDAFDYSLVEYVNNKHPVTLKCILQGHTFICTPSNHLSKRGCPDCSIKKFVSAGETEWLNSLVIPNECRNKHINVSGQRLNVDALINGTIYEYYGDYWHGNMKRFKPDFVNVYSGMTMQEHHDHTMNREQLLREAGYVVVVMWEDDWVRLRKTRQNGFTRTVTTT